MKYDVITFGSATKDIYLKSEKFRPVHKKEFVTGKGVCLASGSKIETDGILLSSGGGGSNTAATFASQGLKTSFCGAVGQDCFGEMILDELRERKINVDLAKRIKGKSTNLSVFLAYPGADRTILVYRGASDSLSEKDISWSKLKQTKWFYLAPFAGKMAGLTLKLVNFAKKNKIKVALNPGYNQLTLPRKTLENILGKVDVLILNREEASLLTKIPYHKEKEVFKKLDGMVKGIVVMTKGAGGATVSDGKCIYHAPSLGLKGVDTTGAGDSFGAGFVSGLIEKNDTVFAIQLAMANSSFNIRYWGAKEGILKKGQKWPKVKVKKEQCFL